MAEVLAIAGVALAVPPVVEFILQSGKDLATRIEAVRSPLSMFGDLSMFRNQEAFLRAQFVVGEQICADSRSPPDIQQDLKGCYRDIERTIREALEYVGEVEKSKKMTRFWLANKPKQKLADSTKKLNSLVQHFMNTVQLVHIKESLPAAVFLSNDTFQPTSAVKPVQVAEDSYLIKGHLTQATQKVQPKNGYFISEHRPYQAKTKSRLGKDIRHLAELLASGKVSDGILDFVGYREDDEMERFELIFDVPSQVEFGASLRRVIETTPIPPLNIRISLCSQVADAILYVRSLNLVHKNISSANILVFHKTGDAPGRKLALVDWRLVRKAYAATEFKGEVKWWRRLYQHPDRQVESAEKEYTMAHDIYSLGVCMFELLMWKSLVTTDFRISEIFQEETVLLGVNDDSDPDDPLSEPNDVQKTLQSLAERNLPAIAGERLTALVIACLNVVELGFDTPGFVEQGNPVETGMNYIAAVKGTLMNIQI